MSEQFTIRTEAQLREAIRALWAEDPTLRWRWKEWQPRHERGLDAIGELAVDKRRITFGVEFRLNPAARDVEFLAKQKHPHPLLLVAPNISATLARRAVRHWVVCGTWLADGDCDGRNIRHTQAPLWPFQATLTAPN